MPALVLALSLPMPVAVGTSPLVIVVHSASALATRVATAPQPVNWALVSAFHRCRRSGQPRRRTTRRVVPARTQAMAFAVLLAAVAVLTIGSATT